MARYTPIMSSYEVFYVGNKSRFMSKESGQISGYGQDKFYSKKWKERHKQGQKSKSLER